MKAHECFHCKQWIPDEVEHDCWTTTEAALTKGLSEDLRDAWERLREAAVEFGEQRIYASHHSIMFARKACYFFVRPQKNRLEVVFFTGRPIKSPFIRKVVRTSKARLAHLVHVIHRDQVEAPFTGWLQEAYGLQQKAEKSKKAEKRKVPLKRKARATRKPATRRRAAR